MLLPAVGGAEHAEAGAVCRCVVLVWYDGGWVGRLTFMYSHTLSFLLPTPTLPLSLPMLLPQMPVLRLWVHHLAVGALRVVRIEGRPPIHWGD